MEFKENASLEENPERANRIEREIGGYRYKHYNRMNEAALRSVIEVKTASAVSRIRSRAMKMSPQEAAAIVGNPVEKVLEEQIMEMKKQLGSGTAEDVDKLKEALDLAESDLSTIQSVNRQMAGISSRTAFVQSSTALPVPGGVSTLLKYAPVARERVEEKYHAEAEKSQASGKGETPEYKAAQEASENFEAAKAALTVDVTPQI